MWVILAFCSAFLLGLYDVFKKKALNDNAVIPVLFLNTLLSLAIYIPFITASAAGWTAENSIFHISVTGWAAHRFIIIKSFLVITSWLFGYFGIKHLPITIVGPINATRPVMVLIGAMAIFGERLNTYQWTGVALAFVSIILLNKTGKKEGINFAKNKWIAFVAISAIFGAASGLYDKYLMKTFSPMFVQSWFNIYQFVIMTAVLMLLWYPKRKGTTPFRWRWSILMIPVTLAVADFLYFYALSFDESMISIVSMIRRSSVMVSFGFGALVFREKNVKSKALDLAFILIGMVFLWIGSR